MKSVGTRFGATIAGMALATGGLLGVVAFVGASAPAGAAASCAGGTIVVSNSSDTGAGSLRQAFADATTADGGTICIDTTVVTSPIAVTSGRLDYSGTGALTILGNGATVQGDGTSAIAYSSSGDVFELDDITITGGVANAGAGVRSGNGTLKLVRSTVTGNTADGTGGFGAGASGPTVIVIDSTISNNDVVDGDGGGVNAGTATIINSTITGNSATTMGGGIEAGQNITLVYSTVVGNSAPQGANVLLNNDVPIISFGTVVAAPGGGGANCQLGAGMTSEGYNYSDDSSCEFTNTATGDVESGTQALLGALAANGGPTQTMLPGTGSALVDAIPTADCQLGDAAGITTDQRGVTRPQLGGCDIGAVEVAPVAPPAPVPTPVAVQPAFTG